MSENLGFLTVIDQSPNGLTGGYLVLNKAGRPLEFHCTVPLLPDKIQQILYGNTLKPFLYGERIAQTLLQRSKLPVLSIFTDHAAVLSVNPWVPTPMIYVFGSPTKPEENNDLPPFREISEELSESLKTFGIDNTRLHTGDSCSDDIPTMPHVPGLDTELWRTIRIGNRLIASRESAEALLISEIKMAARTIDLLEPFARIRRALEEAKSAA
ncbi:MAG: hypothetical protein LBI05_09270 [Planctomycetaceae bacterium]|jgi:hypothetical protein|nr:hypothetical protein [Planctomycetaceae bacterium]